jgi:pyrroloquinoline quinone biosynthesis protein B
MALQAIVLGSAAGGGFPQWNCGCPNCERARRGDLPSRTQDSLAISANGSGWFLLNASPDLARQIQQQAALWPRAARHSPIRGVVLTNGDLDHVLGLLLLRENQPLTVYATREVRAGLEQNAMLKTLQRFEGQLVWHALEYGREQELLGPGGEASGIFVRAFAAPGKPPVHLMRGALPSAGDNCGVSVRATGSARLVYASATSAIEPIAGELDGAAALLLDGTFWSETELPSAGLGRANARDMAHLPMSGSGGSLALCRELRIGQRWYTHINNSNPVLDPLSAEHARLQADGWQLAEDGLRLSI